MENLKENEAPNTIPNASYQGKEKANVPNLRFPEFKDGWTKTKLSNYLIVSKLKNKDNKFKREDVLSVSGELGCVNQIELLGRSFAGASLLPYHVVETNDIVYTKSPLSDYPYGIIKTNRGLTGIVSTLYAVYKAINGASNYFIEHYFSLKSRTNNYLKPIVRIGAKHDMKIGNEEVLDNYVYFPNAKEQEKIANFLDLLDLRIQTQNKIIEDLKTLKLCIIDNIFALGYETSLKSLISEKNIRNADNKAIDVLSISNKYGFIKQSEQFEDHEVASANKRNYKIVKTYDFSYNPARINVGSIAMLKDPAIGIISPMYICFVCNTNEIVPEYLELFFDSKQFRLSLNKRLEGSVRQCLSFDALCSIPIKLCRINEQETIVKNLNILNKKIEVENALLECYKSQKYFLLKNMFI